MSLAGLLDVPSGGCFPLVLLLHGFTGWKEEEHISSLAENLCGQGVGTLRFDAPGSGESEGTLADHYRMTNFLASVGDVVDFVEREFGEVVEDLGIWGHSMGGFVAIASACQRGGFSAVCGSQSSVGKRAFSDGEVKSWQKTGWAAFANDHFDEFELPYDFYVDRQQYDIFKVIDELTAPLLLIAGTNDTVAPASRVRAIYDAANDPKTYLEFPADHEYKNDPNQLAAINAATVEFFVHNLLRDECNE